MASVMLGAFTVKGSAKPITYDVGTVFPLEEWNVGLDRGFWGTKVCGDHGHPTL
jgi:hypothetical protein